MIMGNGLYTSRTVPVSDGNPTGGAGDGESRTTVSGVSIRSTDNGDVAAVHETGNSSARQETDSAELKLQKSVLRNGRFVNSWPSWIHPTLGGVLNFYFFSKDHTNIPDKEELDRQLPILRPDFDLLSKPPESGIRTTWIGHATVLIQMEGVSVLTDPMFSERCSPSQWFGPKRFRSAACQVDELPEITAVLISHNHYDHLDANSVRALNERFGASLRWYVPLRLKSWMRDMSCDNVVELDWWEEDVIPDVPDVKIAFVPSCHWSKRTAMNEYEVLWGGFCVIGQRHRFYFPGDTGYVDDVFKQIGQKYGPFDLAALPIGAYEPRDFMKCQHCNPEDAVLVHKDLRARQSVGIHWGTFALAHEFYLEPPQKLAEALRKHNFTAKDFFTMNLGETRLVADECSELE